MINLHTDYSTLMKATPSFSHLRQMAGLTPDTVNAVMQSAFGKSPNAPQTVSENYGICYNRSDFSVLFSAIRCILGFRRWT